MIVDENHRPSQCLASIRQPTLGKCIVKTNTFSQHIMIIKLDLPLLTFYDFKLAI